MSVLENILDNSLDNCFEQILEQVLDGVDMVVVYVVVQEGKDQLWFLICGLVDDGKLMLIGWLLYDIKLIFED